MVNIFYHLSNVYISQCSLWTEGKLIFPSVQGMSRVRTNGKGVYKGVFSYIFKRLISSLHLDKRCTWQLACLKGNQTHNHFNRSPISWATAIFFFPLVGTWCTNILMATRSQDYLRSTVHTNHTSVNLNLTSILRLLVFTSVGLLLHLELKKIYQFENTVFNMHVCT